ncbi:hypothetical protein [Streptomyces lavendulocolor]|uniref:hypothetical protein n=1 Tax=Streptomyces lavendulocolor TaxID=67316 RepID=UPI001F225378
MPAANVSNPMVYSGPSPPPSSALPPAAAPDAVLPAPSSTAAAPAATSRDLTRAVIAPPAP